MRKSTSFCDAAFHHAERDGYLRCLRIVFNRSRFGNIT
jgi:hypothetical protein